MEPESNFFFFLISHVSGLAYAPLNQIVCVLNIENSMPRHGLDFILLSMERFHLTKDIN